MCLLPFGSPCDYSVIKSAFLGCMQSLRLDLWEKSRLAKILCLDEASIMLYGAMRTSALSVIVMFLSADHSIEWLSLCG